MTKRICPHCKQQVSIYDYICPSCLVELKPTTPKPTASPDSTERTQIFSNKETTVIENEATIVGNGNETTTIENKIQPKKPTPTKPQKPKSPQANKKDNSILLVVISAILLIGATAAITYIIVDGRKDPNPIIQQENDSNNNVVEPEPRPITINDDKAEAAPAQEAPVQKDVEIDSYERDRAYYVVNQYITGLNISQETMHDTYQFTETLANTITIQTAGAKGKQFLVEWRKNQFNVKTMSALEYEMSPISCTKCENVYGDYEYTVKANVRKSIYRYNSSYPEINRLKATVRLNADFKIIYTAIN